MVAQSGRARSGSQPSDRRRPAAILSRSGIALAGGTIGGLAGAAVAAGLTDAVKSLLAVVSRQDNWVLVAAPTLGLALTVVLLQVIAHGTATQHLEAEPTSRRVRFRPWLSFPFDLARADLTADVVTASGKEERFPWRLAPIRAAAIITSVGMGAPLGTEAPAAHLGVAAGAALGSRPWARRIARPAGLGGGAAGVAALMGLPLVGLVFMLELGRRKQTPITFERVLAAGAGATVGWLFNLAFKLDFIRLAVPHVAPGDIGDALATAIVVGATAGAVTGITGVAIYAVRGWNPGPWIKFLTGAPVLVVAAVLLMNLAAPTAAVGPGGGAVVWADQTTSNGTTLLLVVLLRAVATVAAITAGGCGGVFVPFLALGDLTGRALVPLIGGSSDLAGAAGAAGGIAGGYRLRFTAIAMVIGVGGPYSATLTCIATVGVAAAAGVAVVWALDRIAIRSK
ncbi:MAG: chloride channel protein [Microthrixaceae bacterium]|nr:chloride channel protein [Microthrixaceae bacterium]